MWKPCADGETLQCGLKPIGSYKVWFVCDGFEGNQMSELGISTHAKY